jgi:lipopolysaccharide/colanic/teichoic acid biosynthesis glycosyltransferase
MTADQAAETLPLAVIGRVRTAAVRRDARRRTAVAAVDAAAALSTAMLLALIMDTLPLVTALVVPACWTLGAWTAGAYHRQRLKVRLVGVRRLAQTAVVLWAAAGLVAAIAPIRGVHGLVLVAVPVTAVAVCAARAALLPLTRRGGPLAVPPVVVYGTETGIGAFRAGADGPTAPTVAAACVYEKADDSDALDRLTNLVRQTGADTVVVAGDPDHPRPAAVTLRALSWRLEPLGAGVALAPLWQVSPDRVTVRACGDLTLLEVSPPRYEGARLGLRSLCDRVLAGVGLMLLAPALVTIAAVVKCSGPAGPVLFTQWRTGKDGRRFPLLKFRTMVPNADAMKPAMANQYSAGTLFKMPNDPRVTPVGAVLRAFSLDELPQLVNVVRGDMALVGPRPTSTPPEAMPSDYRRRTLVKPGLTGLWQVSGRSALSWDDAVRLDLLYVENRTIAMDLDILRRTLPAVVSRDGAY